MCGRFILFTCDDYEELLSIIRDVELNNPMPDFSMYPQKDIYPGDNVPILVNPPERETSFLISRWGFPDFRSSSRLLFNARSESVEEKPTFRNLVSSKRCLVPAVGFYEWKKNGNAKDKYLIRPKENRLFFMAGLFNTFKDKTGAAFTGFVVITTAANQEMNSIHDRMPVIIPPGPAAGKWLDSGSPWIPEIKPMMDPYHGPLYMENQSNQIQFPI